MENLTVEELRGRIVTEIINLEFDKRVQDMSDLTTQDTIHLTQEMLISLIQDNATRKDVEDLIKGEVLINLSMTCMMNGLDFEPSECELLSVEELIDLYLEVENFVEQEEE